MSNWQACLAAVEEDKRAAELLIDPVPRAAAFHVQQAAEKLIKGVLIAEDIDFSRFANGHAIAQLVQLVPSNNPFRAELARLSALEAYATTFRYPTPSGKLKPVTDLPALARSLASIDLLLKQLTAFCQSRR